MQMHVLYPLQPFFGLVTQLALSPTNVKTPRKFTRGTYVSNIVWIRDWL